MANKYRKVQLYYGSFETFQEALKYISRDSSGEIPMSQDLQITMEEPGYIDLMYDDEVKRLPHRIPHEMRSRIKNLQNEKYNALFIVPALAKCSSSSEASGRVKYLGEFPYDMKPGFFLNRVEWRMKHRRDFFGGLLTKAIMGSVFLSQGITAWITGSLWIHQGSPNTATLRTSLMQSRDGGFELILFVLILVGGVLLFSALKNLLSYLKKKDDAFLPKIKYPLDQQ